MGLFKLFAVSAVVMGIAQTLTKERIFSRLRDRCGGKETWLGYLVSCPYCASHYIAFVIVPLTGAYYVHVAPRWGVVSTVLDWFLSSILVTVIAAFLRVVFYFVDETQGLVRRRQKVVDTTQEIMEEKREVPRAQLPDEPPLSPH